MRFVILLALATCTFGQWSVNFDSGRAGIVHLFEWDWVTIAEECETFLGPAGYGGVQVRQLNLVMRI